MGGAIGSRVADADVAAAAELAVQLSGKMVQLLHRLQLKRFSLRIEAFAASTGIFAAVLPLPGQLNVADHAGIGLHDGGFDPLQLVTMANTAGSIPCFRRRGIGRTAHGGVAFLFVFSAGITAVAVDTISMSIRDMLHLTVTTNAAGTRVKAPAAVQCDQKESKKEEGCQAATLFICCTGKLNLHQQSGNPAKSMSQAKTINNLLQFTSQNGQPGC